MISSELIQRYREYERDHPRMREAFTPGALKSVLFGSDEFRFDKTRNQVWVLLEFGWFSIDATPLPREPDWLALIQENGVTQEIVFGFGDPFEYERSSLPKRADTILAFPCKIMGTNPFPNVHLDGAAIDGGDSDSIIERMTRVTHARINVWHWFLSIHLQWPLDNINPEPDILQPFATTYLPPYGDIPLYATSLSDTPGRKDDRVASVLARIEHCVAAAVAFFEQPLVKEIEGRYYAFYGRFLLNGRWHDFLLNNKSNDIRSVLKQAGSEIAACGSLYDDDLFLARNI